MKYGFKTIDRKEADLIKYSLILRREDTGMLQDRIREGLTFDDVLLVPAKSEVLPSAGYSKE